MKLGLVLGYWGASPLANAADLARAAEQIGYDSVWVAESWGNDAFTYAAHVASATERITIGTSVVQMAARTPTAAAMAAMTMDHLTGGRFILGLGVSGPQVIEGWYGQPSDSPLRRTREYVEIIRQALRREARLTFDGDYYRLPYTGPGSRGLGKPLKIMTHPLRSSIPIFLGAQGPRNVAQTVEIADGWFPIYFSPYRLDVYADQLAARNPHFEICTVAHVEVEDDVVKALRRVRAMLAFYVGGMGAKTVNYHARLMSRMGLEAEASRIQELFLAGRREEAIDAVPVDFADEISLVGPPARIRRRADVWRTSPITTLNVGARSADQLRQIYDVING